ncbi:MAG TPA: energy transducer TonB [Thermoanaerobaculia bacterium]|nr:energy transducer TonB [Thermoanaerobaculia bacterium]
MEEHIDLVEIAEEKTKAGGLSISVVVSFFVHLALIVVFIRNYKPVAPQAENTPMMRYVELIRQNPQEREFVEAPGPKLERPPSLDAPFSDANRRASMPNPTGDRPTLRPGDGSGLYTPPVGSNTPRGAQPQPEQQPSIPQQQTPPAQTATAAQQQAVLDETFVYRERTNATKASAAAAPVINLREALGGLRGSIGSGENLDLNSVPGGGGEIGTADQGQLSFETSWFDWGPYAQSMVSKIRVNWYANMPSFIRSGIGGVVTIRFTIQRDGRITDVTILKSSGHPPYDHAAKKAIELSSPLATLPKDFPNPNERVTAMFYYNTPLP